MAALGDDTRCTIRTLTAQNTDGTTASPAFATLHELCAPSGEATGGSAVPFDPNPTSALAFGDTNNMADWTLAWEGQWFIGVLDTSHKQVYLLPINPRTPDALANSGERNRNRYAAGPESKGLSTDIWNSCPKDWDTRAVGHTTHHKCLNHYHLSEDDCLGFSLIKLDREGKFAMIKLTSNSLNQKPTDPDLTAGPGHSFSRSTHRAAGVMPVYAGPEPKRTGLPYNDPHVPGTTTLVAGTHCMGQGWAVALEAFLHAQGILHTTHSRD